MNRRSSRAFATPGGVPWLRARGATLLAALGSVCALGVACSDAVDGEPEADIDQIELGLCAGARDPYAAKIEAESSNSSLGVILEATADVGGGQNAGSLKDGDWLRFNAVDFGSPGATGVSARVASGAAAGVSGLIEFRLDGTSGTLIGSFAVGSTGGWQTWKTIPANVAASGLHDLYVVFKSGQPSDFVNLNWIQFQGNGGTGSCGGSVSSSASTSTVSSTASSSSSSSGSGGAGGTGGAGGSGGSGGVPVGNIVPLYSGTTPKQPSTTETLANGTIITRVAGRVRDRHAREDMFQAFQHWLPLYFENRTFSVEIIDTIPAGGTSITFNMTTPYPHTGTNFRIFFLGNNTVAEYFINSTFNAVDDYHYTQTVNYNNPLNRNFQVGDYMEFELGIFLRQPVEGRFNYYSEAWLYRAGYPGLVPWEGTGAKRNSVPLPTGSLLGGKTTDSRNESNEPESALMQMAQNLAPANAQPFVQGRRQHHTNFVDGSHSESGNPIFAAHVGKAGPTYNQASCISCHVRNGRSQPPETTGTAIHDMVVKIGDLVNGAYVGHGQYGGQLQTRAVTGSTPEGTLTVGSFQTSTVTASDGTVYTLQKPVYNIQAASSVAYTSARTAPPLVGLGLLEAIDEATILAMADANDANGDGISGRTSVVADVKSGVARLGRFGWKAERASLRQQIAGALREDMGVTTSLFPGANNQIEVNDADLDLFERYVGLLAVSPQRNAGDANVQAGATLFNNAGCNKCHTTNLTTGNNHPQAELRNQQIKPFTDLLLHDMGDGLASTLPASGATTREWRTAPLWNIGLANAVAGKQARYLHDGRARSLIEAILWHGGEAETSKQNVLKLSATQRNQLLAFLQSL